MLVVTSWSVASLAIFRRLNGMAALTYTLDTMRSYAGAFTWEPLVRFSRSTILRLLKRIAVGQLVVRDSDGLLTVCGTPQVKDGSPRTELRVLKETFWVRVFLFADMVSQEIPNIAPPLHDIVEKASLPGNDRWYTD